MQQTRQIGTSSDSHREAIIKEFGYVVKAMAYRLAYRLPAYMDAEDLVSVGIMGLMDAMDKYDPGREAKFKTYAEFRIRGAMLDEIRSMDWIPRSVHERVTLLQRVHAKLLNRHGRPPTDEEVAAEMNLSPSELDEFLVRSQGAVLVSLDDINLHELDGPKILDMLADTHHPDPLAIILNDQERERVADAIQELPEKERLVLTMYYYEELTMKEIGRILKVTESRVCQIHTKAVLHLKGKLTLLK
jgi:RNA polymerase sigma factor for flagellar operon FliA